MRIRALTVGMTVLREDLLNNGNKLALKLTHIDTQLQEIIAQLQHEGYEIQTKRIAFNSFEEWLGPSLSTKELTQSLDIILTLLDNNAFTFCSLGGCSTEWGLNTIPQLLSHSSKFSSSYQFQYQGQKNSIPTLLQCRQAARTVLQLSQQETTGKSNFNFCIAFNCPPNIPFFPVSYHTLNAPPTLSVGLECGDLLFLAFHGLPEDSSHSIGSTQLQDIYRQVLSPIEKIIAPLCSDDNSYKNNNNVPDGNMRLRYGGIDASMNPGLTMTDSVGAGIEQLFPHRFGACGTLASVSAITNALKTLREETVPTSANNPISRSSDSTVKLTGYCGLMLPVMEDQILAARASETPPAYSIRDLLFFSAVCGVGLDMVPVPGEVTVDQLAAIYLEIATLSSKLNYKPLSARILPIPNKVAGEMTSIESEYLINTRIFSASL